MSKNLQQTSPIQVCYKDPIHLNLCHQTKVEQSDKLRCGLQKVKSGWSGAICVTTNIFSGT